MAGNWKMYKTPSATRQYFEQFLPSVTSQTRADVVICPPAIDLVTAVECVKGTAVQIGAQNIYLGTEGAFTGEISAAMVAAAGCTHVIVGHSERRQYFAENDRDVYDKTVAALEGGLTPIVCIGERLAEREANATEAVLLSQIKGALHNLTPQQFDKIVIAYEPVWAIGTGRTATPEIAGEAHGIIRREIGAVFGYESGASVRILYGGSVKPNNAKALMAEHDIDGVLVGGASLEPESFAAIVNY